MGDANVEFAYVAISVELAEATSFRLQPTSHVASDGAEQPACSVSQPSVSTQVIKMSNSSRARYIGGNLVCHCTHDPQPRSCRDTRFHVSLLTAVLPIALHFRSWRPGSMGMGYYKCAKFPLGCDFWGEFIL